eukprot:500357-Prorocentrum_minimum.AAC.1
MADADGCDDAGLLGGPELQPVTTEKGRVYSAGIFSRRTNQTQEAWTQGALRFEGCRALTSTSPFLVISHIKDSTTYSTTSKVSASWAHILSSSLRRQPIASARGGTLVAYSSSCFRVWSPGGRPEPLARVSRVPYALRMYGALDAPPVAQLRC